MIAQLEKALRRLRRGFSRSEWMIRLLGLSTSEESPSSAGLVLIQIDGLAYHQLQLALTRGKMPFLKKLIEREHYSLHPLYSGLPASTPAMQAELFYGVKTAVPAFSYCDEPASGPVCMFEPEAAANVERRLQKLGEPLLKDGSAYSNIFTGGAAEAHFCAAALGWGAVLRAANPFAILVLVMTNAYSFLRILVLLGVEFCLAVADCINGLIDGQNLIKELKLVSSRVAIGIGLRELITIGAKIDTARGLPIVHVNFLGYDEQAHRRGPSSAFAHWSLKGIDDAIARIWRAAKRSARRDYDIWLYSDHGQAHTVPYAERYGRTVKQAVKQVFAAAAPTCSAADTGLAGEPNENYGVQLQRVRFLGGERIQKLLPVYRAVQTDFAADAPPEVAALGPIGLVYCRRQPDPAERATLARKLVDTAAIPLVLVSDSARSARAWTADGEFRLPQDKARLFGADHPFLDEVAEDMIGLCRHPDAGEFVLCGWRAGIEPLSFAQENGAHAGVCPAETEAFALLPNDASLVTDRERCLRPLNLRQSVARHLGRDADAGSPKLSLSRRRQRDTLRLMTYNVHSCIGMDGKLSPQRIARVIAQYQPDIVALQELDQGRKRTGGIDQAHQIAHYLEMAFHFHPALHLEEERYGDAILTHLPMRLIKAGLLPGLASRPRLEPRGALWAGIDIGQDSELQIINTHLGLSGKERQQQIGALLGKEWLGHPQCGEVILCGDLNLIPASSLYRRLGRRLHDAQRRLANHRPKATLSGRYPTLRIDHVFVSEKVDVLAVAVPRTAMTRVASDHLPLLVDVKISKG